MTRAGGHFEGASREIRKCTYSLSERQKGPARMQN